MVRVELRGAALQDIEAASQWYEREEAGLGFEFVEAVDATLAAIAEQPRLFAVIHRDARRALVNRFPYGVFYRYLEGSQPTVIVLAVIHLHRDSSVWRRRV